MSIQTIIANDITNVFSVAENTPLSVQAVYTPVGGVAQTAVTLLYSNTPLTGDEQQNYSVEQEDILVMGKPVDVSGWVINGKVTIKAFDYEIVSASHPTDSYWSIITLRTPTRNKTKI